MPVTSALIKSHPDMNLNHVDLNQSNWTQSLFRRMKFIRRLSTTGKVPISESLHRELETSYLHVIIRKMEENSTPLSLVFNVDETPTTYVPVFNKMVPKG